MSHYRYAIRQRVLSTGSCCPHVALSFPHVSLVVVTAATPPWGEQLTRSVGKAPTTSSHLLTTSARFCYTKCAEVCSRMRLSIRHVAHQNGFFAVSGISFLSLSPPSLSLSLPPLSSCLSGRLFFIFSGLLFGFLGDFY